MASNAELYFSKISSPEYGYDYLVTLPERRQKESEWLDFKAADKIDDRGIKENWSKALSGFGNTEGGVLIWGIEAKRLGDVDCATALALASDADGFAQKLNDVLLNAVAPPIRGILIQAIKKAGQKEGFVICYIPEGHAKAYRAELADQQFYLRISDKFIVPSAAIIRSLFHRVESPILVPSVWVSCDDTRSNIKFNIDLTNKGTLTAEQMLVIMHCEAGTQCTQHQVPEVSRRLTMANPRESAFELHRYLHPYMPPMTFAQLILAGAHTQPPQVYLRIRICCRNTSPTTWSCLIPKSNYYRHNVDFKPDEEPWPDQPELPREKPISHASDRK